MPGRRPEALRHVLGVQPAFDRVAGDRDVVLGEPERSAVGDLELEGDEVPPGHGLADGMLDLDPAVDLKEEELLGDGIDDELDGPRLR